MRKVFSLIVAALLVTVVGTAVLAQTHMNSTERKATDELRFASDVMIGTHLLKAGRYQVSCDAKAITFSRIDVGPGIYTTTTKVLEVPCQGKELAARVERTEVSLPLNKAGVATLEKLLLKGSNIEHVFPN